MSAGKFTVQFNAHQLVPHRGPAWETSHTFYTWEEVLSAPAVHLRVGRFSLHYRLVDQDGNVIDEFNSGKDEYQ